MDNDCIDKSTAALRHLTLPNSLPLPQLIIYCRKNVPSNQTWVAIVHFYIDKNYPVYYL